MESMETYDLEEGEILEHDLNSLKDSLSNEKDGFEDEGYVNEHLKRKLDLQDQKNYYKTIDNGNVNMLDSISSSEEEFNTPINQNGFISHNRHFNFYTKRRSRLKEAQDRLMLNGSAEDIMCQIDQTICRKSHSYNHKKHKDFRYGWEKLYEKKNCSSRHRSQEMNSSHKLSGKKKVVKSKAFSDGSDSDEYFKSSLHRKKKSCHKKRKEKDSDDYYCNGHSTNKKNYRNGVKKPVNKIFRDFDEVRRTLLEKLKQQEMEMKKIPEIVDQNTCLDAQEGNISMDSSNSEAEPSKKFNNVLINGISEKNSQQKTSENVSLDTDNEEDLDIVQLRLIALASNRKQKNVDNLNQSFQETEKMPANKLECGSLFDVNSENNGRETKEEEEEEEEEEDDADLNRYELLLRAEALKTALLKKHQKRLIKLKTPKLNQLENNNENGVVSSKVEIPSLESNTEQPYQESTIQEGGQQISEDFKLNLENDSLTENFDKENDMEVVMDSVNTLQECEKDINADKFSQSSENANKKYQKTKSRKRKKKPSLSEDGKEKLKNNQTLEEDCLTLRSQLLRDLIKKKTLKDSEKKSVLLDSAQISTSNTESNINNSEKNTEPFKKFKVSPKTIKNVPKIPKPEIQRIIVHLGSEESSEDEEVSKGRAENNLLNTAIPNQAINVGAAKNTTPEELRASYERSVELLLSEARKKIETEMGKPKSNEVATPEAVYKHLPPSQRLEYIRLKQKIAERERLRKMMRKDSSRSVSNIRKEDQSETTTAREAKDTVEQSTPEGNNKVQQQSAGSKNSPTDISLPTNVTTSTATVPTTAVVSSEYLNASNLKTANKRVVPAPNQFLRSNKLIVKERNSLLGVKNGTTHCNPSNVKELTKKNVSLRSASRTPLSNQSNSIRTSHTQILLSKLKLLLKKIKIEKTIEENYEKEISKLKNQLSLFEKKKSEQRFKIKKLAEESVKTYKVIQNMAGSKNTSSVKEVKENSKFSSGSENKKDDEADPVKSADGDKKVEKTDKNEITQVEKIEENSDKMEIVKEENSDKAETVKEENPDKTETVTEENSDGAEAVTEENSDKVETVKDQTADVMGVCGTVANELAQYNSPLEVFSKSSDNLKRVDPNVEMCQFDLTGICRDEECTYQHLRPS